MPEAPGFASYLDMTAPPPAGRAGRGPASASVGAAAMGEAGQPPVDNTPMDNTPTPMGEPGQPPMDDFVDPVEEPQSVEEAAAGERATATTRV